MSCCGDREKQEFLKTEQKWDYINLNDFKRQSCWTPFAYAYLIVMLIVSISVYVVDTFTAVNLIAFDKWAGQVKPAIPLSIARWIFAGCIIASVVLLIYRWLRAIRVMRGGGVAKSYLDPLAVRVQCIRPGETGRGFKRFLVFAELTKSRKGADYVALFAYFSFEAWLRIVFAEGPRQVVNAITLWGVLQANLIPTGNHAVTHGNSPFSQFWVNVGALFSENKLQAAVICGMVWTLLIWVISAISLAVSAILYLVFLWHHIPGSEGLTSYCRKKINRRMERIVRTKVDKALKKENELRTRQEARAAREGFEMKKQPTLPDLDSMPPLSRTTTMTTLPEYDSEKGIRDSNISTVPPLPGPLGEIRPGLSRHMTRGSDASWDSHNSSAPLMAGAGEMGNSSADRMHTPTSSIASPWSAGAHPPFPRPGTAFSQFPDRSMTPGPPRPGTAQSGMLARGPAGYPMEQLQRPGTGMSNARGPRRQGSNGSDVHSAGSRPSLDSGAPPPGVNGSYFPPVTDGGRSTPGFSGPGRSNTPNEPPPRSFTPAGVPPLRSMTPQGGPPPNLRSFSPRGPPPRSLTDMGPPSRSLTGSVPPPRSFTPSAQPPPRSFTPGPRLSPPSLRSNTPQQAPPPASIPDNIRPTLPQLDTSSTANVASTANDNGSNSPYRAFNPRSGTPVSASTNPPRAPFVAHEARSTPSPAPGQPLLPTDEPFQPPQPPYRSFSRPLGPAHRNSDINRDSGFDEILGHYD